MIIFTAALCLIITVVIALAGVAASSGSIHSLGGHFVLSGHQLSSLSAGKLSLSPIVVRIAGLLGFSILLGACTWRLTSRGSQRVPTGSRRETTALRLDRDRAAGEPVQRSRAHIGRPGRGLARCCGRGEPVDGERFASAHLPALGSLHFLGARAPLEALMAPLPGERTSAAGAGGSSPASQLEDREKAASCLPTHRRPRRLRR
jgi:hypothetical protein